MNSTKVIEIKVVKATSLDQFKTEKGIARMKMPYWTFTSDGSIVGEIVWYDTDPKKLEKQIENGDVYIQEKYFDRDAINRVSTIHHPPSKTIKNKNHA